jgi:hypothetical protein
VQKLGNYAREQLKEIQSELADRRIEALKLYVPGPEQERMHACRSSEILVIGGNRSGKSLSTFIEDARAVCGKDPHGKYPLTDGILVIVGKDWKHIGMTVYPMLFKADAFKIIKDAVTGQWRAYNPPLDKARASEAKPAPPLIPPRLIKKKSWIDKGNNQIQYAELTNGWQIYFCSSEGDPPQGFKADRVHIDEDISNEQWVPEMQGRLSDKKGNFSWSAMPHSKNDALLGLKERAESESELAKEKPDISMFKLRFLDNPHIDDDEKRKRLEGWASLGEDVLRMRSEGDFITDSILCYPTFSMSIHGFERGELPQLVVPEDWCRYAVIDPGHSVTSVLFAAVPPNDDMLLVYDQLYIRQCNAVTFGEKFAQKVFGQSFHAFIIDMHGGRIRDIGSGRLPVEQYSEQLRSRNIRSTVTGCSFLAGCDDIPARMTATQTYMHIRPEGTPRLRVLRGACPDLEREIKRYKKKTNYVGGAHVVTDAPNTRGEVHACQCLEYLCAYRPKYHKPKVELQAEPWYVGYVRRKKKKQNGGDNFVYLGPSSGGSYATR